MAKKGQIAIVIGIRELHDDSRCNTWFQHSVSISSMTCSFMVAVPFRLQSAMVLTIRLWSMHWEGTNRMEGYSNCCQFTPRTSSWRIEWTARSAKDYTEFIEIDDSTSGATLRHPATTQRWPAILKGTHHVPIMRKVRGLVLLILLVTMRIYSWDRNYAHFSWS